MALKEHRQDFRSCVYDKERAVKHGLEFLENLVEIIQKDTGKFTELQIYMGQAGMHTDGRMIMRD